MSIWAEMFDAGTTMIIDPLVNVPGMDQGYFRELDMEYTWPAERQALINEELIDTPFNGTYRPWPGQFPWRMWVDYTDKYAGVSGGLKSTFYHWDQYLSDFEPVPSDLAQIEKTADYEPNVERRYERMTRQPDSEEIAATFDEPEASTEYLRLPVYNEPGGKHGANCNLLDPLILEHHGHVGYEYKLVLDYNPLFAPVDMRHPEWYDIVRPDGSTLDQVGKQHVLSLLDNGAYRIYMRPANWRWVASVSARYIYISWFEAFYTQQIFTHAWFNRPPIYPVRHDLIHTSKVLDFEYQGSYYSTDAGVEYGFNSSRGAGWLRYQIIDAQWWTLSEAYIFVNNEPAKLVLWLWPPEEGDIVLGLGEIDRATGSQQTFWLRQNRDLTDVYPRTVLGLYIILDFVVAE